MSSEILPQSQHDSKAVIGVEYEALQALKEREERLSLVIDAAKIGTWDFDPRTGILLWDARCRALFGMAPDDPVDYATFLNGIHPQDRQVAHEANQHALDGLDNGEYDLEYRTIGLRDKKLRWVRAKGRSYKNEQGVCIRYAGTVIDITGEKQQQQRLREQEERFRLLATSIPQIVWTADEEGTVDYMSDNWRQYTGHVPTYEKFSFRQLMHPDDLDQVIPQWNDCAKKGITFRSEYRLKNIVTNEYRWFSCTTSPLFDEAGKVIKWVGSATDIQDRKTTELTLEAKVAERTRELKELNERLEKSNADLEQYAYVTSHDLKEPLRKIKTYCSRIASEHPDELRPEVARYFSKISSTAGRMSKFIDELLKYSKLSSANAVFEEVNLNDTIQNLFADFDYAFTEKRISVEARFCRP